MIAKIKARYSNGVLTPLEPIELNEGDEVTISVGTRSPLSSEERREMLRSLVGAWKGRVDGEAMKRQICEARRVGSREEPVP